VLRLLGSAGREVRSKGCKSLKTAGGGTKIGFERDKGGPWWSIEKKKNERVKKPKDVKTGGA